jgi:hypothetical protein
VHKDNAYLRINVNIKVRRCTSTPLCACMVPAVCFVHAAGCVLKELSGSCECWCAVAVGLYNRVTVLCSETVCVSETDGDTVCCG